MVLMEEVVGWCYQESSKKSSGSRSVFRGRAGRSCPPVVLAERLFHVGLLDSGVPFSADLVDKPVV